MYVSYIPQTCQLVDYRCSAGVTSVERGTVLLLRGCGHTRMILAISVHMSLNKTRTAIHPPKPNFRIPTVAHSLRCLGKSFRLVHARARIIQVPTLVPAVVSPKSICAYDWSYRQDTCTDLNMILQFRSANRANDLASGSIAVFPDSSVQRQVPVRRIGDNSIRQDHFQVKLLPRRSLSAGCVHRDQHSQHRLCGSRVGHVWVRIMGK